MAYHANWMTKEFRDFRAAEVSAEKQRRSQENVRGLGKNSKNASLASHKLNANGGTSVINWKDYANDIPERAWQMLIRFSREPMHTQASFCEEDEEAFASSTMIVLKKVLKERPQYYIVTILDELFKENKRMPRIFKGAVGTNLDPFMILPDLVNREWNAEGRAFKDVLPARACYVLSHFLNAGLIPGTDAMQKMVPIFFDGCDDKRTGDSKRFVRLAMLGVIQGMLRTEDGRERFMEHTAGFDRLEALVAATSKGGSIKTDLLSCQEQYQLLQCVWLLTYSEKYCAKLMSDTLLAYLKYVLSNHYPEKMTRMVLSALVNMTRNDDNTKHLLVWGFIPIINEIHARLFDDHDIVSDIIHVHDILEKAVEVHSTFKAYSEEVANRSLEWTPMHQSHDFWMKNSHNFLDEGKGGPTVIKGLLQVLEDPSSKSRAHAVALHDIGMLMSYQPKSRTLITQLEGRTTVMTLMTDAKDEEVQAQALLCFQKMILMESERA